MALVHPVNITYCVCAPHIILGTEKIVNRTQTSERVPALMELSFTNK